MKNLFIILILLIIASPLYSQDPGYKKVSGTEEQEILLKLKKASAAINTLQCNFIQKKKITVLSETVTSKGNMLFKSEDKLCWEYNFPYYYLFALNGEKVYLKNDKSTKQFDTRSNAMFKELSVLLVNSIKGAGLIDPKKFAASYYQSESVIKVVLLPKNKTIKSILSDITLYFNKNDFLVHTIEMNEASGDNTTIQLNNIKLNQKIDDEKFLVH